jgi:hypothetical protein
MTGSLQEFVTALEQQAFFDPDDGDIVNVRYTRLCKDEKGRPYAKKYAYFRAYQTLNRNRTARESRHYVFYALRSDMEFAHAGGVFDPQEGDCVSISYFETQWHLVVPYESKNDMFDMFLLGDCLTDEVPF